MAALSVPARGRCRLALRAYEITPFCVCEPGQISCQPRSLLRGPSNDSSPVCPPNAISKLVLTSSLKLLHRRSLSRLSENREIAAKVLSELTHVTPPTQIPVKHRSQRLARLSLNIAEFNASRKHDSHFDGRIRRTLPAPNQRANSLSILPNLPITTRSHNLRKSHRE
jgi:hypothetical protein